MAGELIRKIGAEVQIASGLVLPAGIFTQVSSFELLTHLSVYASYPELVIALQVTAGTPEEGITVECHERFNVAEPPPSGLFTPHYMGSIILDNQIGTYIKSGLMVNSPDSTLYLKSNSAVSLTTNVSITPVTLTAAS